MKRKPREGKRLVGDCTASEWQAKTGRLGPSPDVRHQPASVGSQRAKPRGTLPHKTILFSQLLVGSLLPSPWLRCSLLREAPSRLCRKHRPSPSHSLPSSMRWFSELWPVSAMIYDEFNLHCIVSPSRMQAPQGQGPSMSASCSLSSTWRRGLSVE